METLDRFKKAWSVFNGRDRPNQLTDQSTNQYEYYYGSSYRPDQPYYSFTTKRSLVTAIYNRIAVDTSMIDIKHVQLKKGKKDADRQYSETINDDLNYALTCSANVDQTARSMIKELVLQMFDTGCAAMIPYRTDVNPLHTDSFTVEEIRIGKIVEWYPYDIKIDLYREQTNRHEELTLPKSIVPIVYNPFYEIMNEKNGTLQRLMRTISQLEKSNGDTASGKLNIIFQLPYAIKSEARVKQANERKKALEDQLALSKYGIAYADATERIIQLNRPLENNLWEQTKELESQLYNQLGLTQNILNGTADENERLNYYNNTIEPILCAITEEIERKWITKKARSKGQAIMYIRNPFKLIPVNEIAKMADTFTRNEIASSNEFRSIIGFKPSSDPKADALENSNLNQSKERFNEIQNEE